MVIKSTVVATLLLLLSACGETRLEYPPRQAPPGFLEDESNQRQGKALFSLHCTQCHGRIGAGRSPRADFFSPPAPDFSEKRYRHDDPAYLFWRIESGKTVEPFRSRGSVMPAWGPHLSETQIWQLVAYLRQR